MALLDMIKNSLAESEAVKKAVESHTRESLHEDLSAMEHMGMDFTPAQEPNFIPTSAMDVLKAVESHLNMIADTTNESNADNSKVHEIAKAIEESLPTDAPAYDPSEELEDIANVLAGIDSDDDVDPDQPQPEDEVDAGSTIHDMMTEPKDTVDSSDPDANGTVNL